MPILKREDDLYPPNLLDLPIPDSVDQQEDDQLDLEPEAMDRDHWWCLYTVSRQEKVLMRKLFQAKRAFCCPLIEKRYRSPAGRMRSSFLPLFTNYVFLRGNQEDRRFALSTNCVQSCQRVIQPADLVDDLKKIYFAIVNGQAITAESKLQKGDPVLVKSGPFKGFEGYVQRRAGKTRFLIDLKYLEQGVSMEIDEGSLQAV